ncbi:MAG TPA: hypothetical protein VKQ30_08850 [Ktedonobacterales bacterium]|nr:hypothetical protein [Ktedonobacterales bacterium]
MPSWITSARIRVVEVLFFLLTHPRWEVVFQPTYAAYLNLIEPWWKILRSLALKGRRFETWAELCRAVAAGRPTGMPTSIHLSGAVGGASDHVGKLALDWCPQLRELAGCTIKAAPGGRRPLSPPAWARAAVESSCRLLEDGAGSGARPAAGPCRRRQAPLPLRYSAL